MRPSEPVAPCADVGERPRSCLWVSNPAPGGARPPGDVGRRWKPGLPGLCAILPAHDVEHRPVATLKVIATLTSLSSSQCFPVAQGRARRGIGAADDAPNSGSPKRRLREDDKAIAKLPRAMSAFRRPPWPKSSFPRSSR